MVTPHYEDQAVSLHHGDCLDVLRSLPDGSVDAVVTDPPYGLGFMGKDWDNIKQEESRPPSADETDARFNNKYPRTGKGPAAVAFDGCAFQQWCEQWAAECLRVLKPGGHLLAFGGTRTWHRLACAVEDAGFEIRDSIAWLYASGFPKSLDVSKAIDRAAGAEREVVGERSYGDGHVQRSKAPRFNGTDYANGQVYTEPEVRPVTAPATSDAQRWQGWGTALKPAHEPIVVARKPLAGTVAGNVLAYGTGALNVDGCRVGVGLVTPGGGGVKSGDGSWNREDGGIYDAGRTSHTQPHTQGRWPANVVLDGSQAAALDEQSGETVSGSRKAGTYAGLGYMGSESADFPAIDGDSGGASRFFFVAKAPTDERPRIPKADADPKLFAGSIRKRCTKCGKQEVNVGTSACACPTPDFQPDPSMSGYVSHPTVKPLELMRWLVRLVTPPGGTVLEPFAGSGTTVEACILEGFKCVAIEREAEYLPLIESRIARRRDPVKALELAGEDGGLFDLLPDDEGDAA